MKLGTRSHSYFKIIRVNQGWKTGRAVCRCGTEFPVRFALNEKGDPILRPGARCPKGEGAPSRTKATPKADGAAQRRSKSNNKTSAREPGLERR